MVRLRALLFLTSVLVTSSVLAAESTSLEAMVEKSMPAIVAIRSDTPQGISSGTGFLVDPTGVVVTNLHVIEGATLVAVKLHSGEQYTRVRVASYDQERDLVILRIPGFNLPTVKLGNSDSVKAGASVIAIGNPLGLEESVTQGIVSSVRVLSSGTKVIQTDSALSPGNSGGPLINRNGEVIGVVTFKFSSGENINFAMPINYVRALLTFETLISLEELAQELGKKNVSLFAENDSEVSLTGTWLSLESNNRRQLRQDGDYLFGTYRVDNADGVYDLKLQDDGTYKGFVRGTWRSWYTNLWSGNRVDVVCRFEEKFELKIIDSRRLEGRNWAYKWPKSSSASKKAKKTCGKSEIKNMEWFNFTWVRVD